MAIANIATVMARFTLRVADAKPRRTKNRIQKRRIIRRFLFALQIGPLLQHLDLQLFTKFRRGTFVRHLRFIKEYSHSS
jgi:hypothetical protein